MSMKNDIPLGPAAVTPGEILEEEFLLPLGMSQNALAQRMGISRMRISEIVRGRHTITAETAILLGRTLGTSPRFWTNLQTAHDLATAADRLPSADIF
jgi:addiction module HigA family antidote